MAGHYGIMDGRNTKDWSGYPSDDEIFEEMLGGLIRKGANVKV
jgi:hypothetical protein